MISGRNVVLAAVVILVLSLIMNAISLMQPLSGDKKGTDTYGVYPSGHRGLLEVLQALELPAKRTHAPFDEHIAINTSYVMIGPDIELLESEAGTLGDMKTWVESGGRLVVSFVEGWPSPQFIETFDLSETRFSTFDTGVPLYEVEELDPASKVPVSIRRMMKQQAQRSNRMKNRTLGGELKDALTFREPECQRFPIDETTGNAAAWCKGVQHIALRAGDAVSIDTSQVTPDSQVIVRHQKESRTILAEFKRGRGAVVLVSDVSLFDNLSMREGDNSVLMVNLLTDSHAASDATTRGETRSVREVRFDEFYHGLAIRGNPLWVFAQPGYRLVTFILLTTITLFIWREMTTFGIVHPPDKTPRRTLSHYLDAISRLLLRSRDQLPQLIIESKNSFLWQMARSLKLPGERNQQRSIQERLERKDSALLNEFNSILETFDRYHQNGCRPPELLSLLQRSQSCLLLKVTGKSARKSNASSSV